LNKSPPPPLWDFSNLPPLGGKVGKKGEGWKKGD